MTWRWISQASVEVFHSEQIERFGGARGLRDLGMLQSALDWPQNKAAYGEPDAFDLAAAYLYGIARNHPFVDGNKRTAIVVAAVFLMKHDYRITADNGMVYQFVMDVAAGAVSEESAARWFRDFTEKAA
ncbi:type II toxin-antitoxin system death-on-curing family toxin [Aurantimonas sp. VKM B-3413]|uniref:type II toxin-antitoxin system death-on-curing family toxin n=1 Tax=Aurantimonas sp. VKM B-3413 TaxID=2779401 RepID=UPI001E2FC26B|nr:type II toxin-antitoxin system death-on-curing family toxin [Aurantimonas sp. VKM B-3413]MCB8838831.1 type II toxin-antitoxin system death-on-curing family toxin [Aurantimonas sp. VKM B-3413]